LTSASRTRFSPAKGSVTDFLPVAPAPVEVFFRCCARLSHGETWTRISRDEGMDSKALWAACIVRSRQAEYSDPWADAQRLEVELRKRSLLDRSEVMLQAAAGEIPMREEVGNTPGGPVSRTITEKSPSALAAGAAIQFPREHGRLARGNDEPPKSEISIGQLLVILNERGAEFTDSIPVDSVAATAKGDAR